MLVYSVASQQSFEMVKIIRDKVLTHLVGSTIHHHLSYSIQSDHITPNHSKPGISKLTSLSDTQGADWVPIVVVGNKSDLHIQRQVTAEEGKALTQQWNCAWTEASARHNENVAKAFELMIDQVEKAQNPSAPPGGGKCLIM